MVTSLAVMPPSTRSTVVGAGRRPVGAHRLEQVAGLVADRFERGARDLGRRRIAGQAEDRAARLRVPIGRAEADEGRHQIDLLGRIGARARARRSPPPCAMMLQAVAQPLHRGAGDEDRAFQRIGALAVELIGDGGEQAVAARSTRSAPVLSSAKQPVP